MPSIQHNLALWNDPQSWSRSGEQWSDRFGGSDIQWNFFLRPRLLKCLPAKDVLEISPGSGRWTQYLKRECESLTLVDLSHVAIENCKRRFAQETQMNYFVNDGLDLSMVPSASQDLIFSFDSLVHADHSVLESYISQFPRILKPHGLVFLHHSNLKSYDTGVRKLKPLVRFGKVRKVLDVLGFHPFDEHLRDWSVSGDWVVQVAKKSGISCVSQEFLRWEGNFCFIDCISVLAMPGSENARPLQRIYNRSETRDIQTALDFAKLYLAK